jgi:hypothetical protein
MAKTVTVTETKPLKVSVPIGKKPNRIANLGTYAHPQKKAEKKRK